MQKHILLNHNNIVLFLLISTILIDYFYICYNKIYLFYPIICRLVKSIDIALIYTLFNFKPFFYLCIQFNEKMLTKLNLYI